MPVQLGCYPCSLWCDGFKIYRRRRWKVLLHVPPHVRCGSGYYCQGDEDWREEVAGTSTGLRDPPHLISPWPPFLCHSGGQAGLNIFAPDEYFCIRSFRRLEEMQRVCDMDERVSLVTGFWLKCVGGTICFPNGMGYRSFMTNIGL